MQAKQVKRSPSVESHHSELDRLRTCSMEIINGSEREQGASKTHDFTELSIFNSPITSVRVLLTCLLDFAIDVLHFLIRNYIILSTIGCAIFAFLYLPGPHELVSIASTRLTHFVVPLDNPRLHVLRSVLARTWNCQLNWSWDRTAHLCSLLGPTHCKGGACCPSMSSDARIHS